MAATSPTTVRQVPTTVIDPADLFLEPYRVPADFDNIKVLIHHPDPTPLPPASPYDIDSLRAATLTNTPTSTNLGDMLSIIIGGPVLDKLRPIVPIYGRSHTWKPLEPTAPQTRPHMTIGLRRTASCENLTEALNEMGRAALPTIPMSDFVFPFASFEAVVSLRVARRANVHSGAHMILALRNLHVRACGEVSARQSFDDTTQAMTVSFTADVVEIMVHWTTRSPEGRLWFHATVAESWSTANRDAWFQASQAMRNIIAWQRAIRDVRANLAILQLAIMDGLATTVV
ncbi:hypothetical protein EJ06DRAFT_521946 [Trichodelitschia bisporula]|uniref:DUF7924 domain-containing protein n=1 Tax=Trichodelitschia bisporula TaxID=703511 RepID=A0A6G1HWQ6_9PEZI|nr:hypothetical protein EJ06DRAFT_521946 [Trichodelitschia bisporula]